MEEYKSPGRAKKFRRFGGIGKKFNRPEEPLDHKSVAYLQTFVSPQYRILSRKRTGFNGKDQKKLKLAIKRARFLALLPYTG